MRTIPFIFATLVMLVTAPMHAQATNVFGMLADMTFDDKPLQCGELLGDKGRIYLPGKGNRVYCRIGEESYVAVREESENIRIKAWWDE